MISFKSKITRTILGYFILHDGDEMYVNEMARRFDFDSGNLTRKLAELEGVGILKSRRIGDQKHYSLNKSFPLIKEVRKIVLVTIGIEAMLRNALKEVKGVKRALIFGSYAKDEMDPLSDIDLLVIGEHNNIDLQKQIVRVQKQINREINLISMTSKDYNKKKEKDDLLKSVDQSPKVNLI